MDTYSQKNLHIAGIIAGLSILTGILGWWLINSDTPMIIAFIPLGITGIIFNRDLAMERIVKHRLDSKYCGFARGTYIFIGSLFVVISVIILASH